MPGKQMRMDEQELRRERETEIEEEQMEPVPVSDGFFIFVLLTILAARLAIFLFAPAPAEVVTAINWVFGVAGVVTFGRWVRSAWECESWFMLPRAFIIVTSIVIAISQLTAGRWWLAKGINHSVVLAASGVVFVCMLIAASRLWGASVATALEFLSGPIRFIKKRRKDGNSK